MACAVDRIQRFKFQKKGDETHTFSVTTSIFDLGGEVSQMLPFSQVTSPQLDDRKVFLN